jgi:hypothetical protein
MAAFKRLKDIFAAKHMLGYLNFEIRLKSQSMLLEKQQALW